MTSNPSAMQPQVYRASERVGLEAQTYIIMDPVGQLYSRSGDWTFQRDDIACYASLDDAAAAFLAIKPHGELTIITLCEV